MNWNTAQNWEKDWHGTCQNTYGEEEKQLLYANRMGLRTFHNGKSPYNFDLEGKSVIDIGGGPCSLLLKCVNGKRLTVVDPLEFPGWVGLRYVIAGIDHQSIKAEDIIETGYDLALIYNVLQHTDNPDIIIKNALRVAKEVRIFEWIDTPTNEGHPHTLTEEKLNKWLGGEGKVEVLNGQANCFGKCYYGIFNGKV